jgi:hypothetical protein
VKRNLLHLHRNPLPLHPEQGAEEGSAVRAGVRGIILSKGLELADERRASEGRDVIGQHPVALDLAFAGLRAGIDRNDEAAFGLFPERLRRKAFLNPDAEQGVPVPPYPAFGGFAFFVPKKPSMIFDSTFKAAS